MFDSLPNTSVFSRPAPFHPHSPARVLDSLVLVAPVEVEGPQSGPRLYKVVATGRNCTQFQHQVLGQLHCRKKIWLNEARPSEARGQLALVADQQSVQQWHQDSEGQPLIVHVEPNARPGGHCHLRWLRLPVRRPA